MPILNMITQGGGGGGGNIGEPLNLTVTTSGLDATITWEDNEIGTIPPTTFQKSELVRKIGSAPTSPSDGDLVVTETVKDTYKVSGYVDSGLTDGTTYYYRVFSYSDLGGISYCDAESVTISSSRQPGANTIAYYPLTSTSTVNDMSGNNLTLTGGGTYQFGTYGGVDCCSISNGYFTANHSGSGDITILAWCNYQGEPAHDTGVIAMTYNSTDGHPVSQIGYNKKSNRPNYDPDGGIYGYAQGGGIDYTSNYHENANQWYLVAGTWDGSNVDLYINGNLEKTITITSGTSTYTLLGVSRYTRSMVGYVSNVIFENKIWTAQEIADYLDQTKSLYGIS